MTVSQSFKAKIVYTDSENGQVSSKNFNINNRTRAEFLNQIKEFCPISVVTPTKITDERMEKMNKLIQQTLGTTTNIYRIPQGKAELISDGMNIHYLINEAPVSGKPDYVSFDIIG